MARFFEKKDIKHIIIILAVFFLLQASVFYFIGEDSYITLRVARNFANGNGLVFNVGEHVEANTSFLWTVMLAGFMKSGLDILLVTKIISVFFVLLAILALYLLSKSILKKYYYLPAYFLLLYFPFTMYYGTNGFETPMFLFLIFLSIWLFISELEKSEKTSKNSNSASYYSAIPLALSLLTRPEGIVIALVLIAYRFFVIKDMKKNIIYASLVLLPFVLLVAWRYSFYGMLVPNTVVAKSWNGFVYKILAVLKGVKYLMDFMLFIGAMFIVPCLMNIKKLFSRRETRILMLVTAVYIVLLTLTGGDTTLPLFRAFITVIPFIFILFVVSLLDFMDSSSASVSKSKIQKKSKNQRRNKNFLFLIVILLIFAILIYQLVSLTLQNNFFKQEDYRSNQFKDFGLFLSANTQTGQTIVYGDIGRVAYYAPNLIFIDTLGLADKHIAARKGITVQNDNDWTKYFKDRKFDPDYIYSRNPDYILMIFNRPYDANMDVSYTTYYVDQELMKHPSFSNYEFYFDYTINDAWHYVAFKRIN